MAQGVRDGGRGVLEVVTEWIQPNPAEEFAMLCRIGERSRRPVLYSLTQYHEQPDDYRASLALNRQALPTHRRTARQAGARHARVARHATDVSSRCQLVPPQHRQCRDR